MIVINIAKVLSFISGCFICLGIFLAISFLDEFKEMKEKGFIDKKMKLIPYIKCRITKKWPE